MFAFENYLDSWNSDYVFKIESDAHKLYNFLKKHYDDLCPFDQKLVDEMQFYNSDNHGGWTPKLMKMKKSLATSLNPKALATAMSSRTARFG